MPMRVRERYRHEPCALLDPASGAHIVPNPTSQYAEDDPMVLNAPWYFIREGVSEEPASDSVRISDVEQATRAPGEKRATRRTSG